jgi:hypothetical protein
MPVLEQERQIMAVGNSYHWDFRVLGVAPVPATAIHTKDWWLVPLHQDTSAIPARALERVRTLYEAGIRPKAFVIAHEAPKQIAPPKDTPIVSPFAYWTKRAADSTVTVLKGAGRVLAVVAPVLLAALGTGFLVGVSLAGALVADPCLIAVTDDDVWIQIDYWMA